MNALEFDAEHIQQALSASFSKCSAKQSTPDNPAAGHCNVTAALIHDIYGGEILKTKLPQGFHFYNRVNSQVFDFTASQFCKPIEYNDLASDRREVAKGFSEMEYEEIKRKFLQQMGMDS